MKTSVTLADRSRPSVEQALRQALDGSVQGALAMGLAWMCVDRALVLPDAVVLRAVGSDEELQEQAAAKLDSASCRRFSDARR